jgi:hypothetical protein
MRKSLSVIFCLACLALCGCSGAPGAGSQGSGSEFEDAQISALGAIGRMETALSGPLFEGDGGKDIRLAVYAPEIQGSVPAYLPVYIQGLLNTNFSKYSAVTIIARDKLDVIIAEQDLGANQRFSETDYISIGKLTNAQYFLFESLV